MRNKTNSRRQICFAALLGAVLVAGGSVLGSPSARAAEESPPDVNQLGDELNEIRDRVSAHLDRMATTAPQVAKAAACFKEESTDDNATGLLHALGATVSCGTTGCLAIAQEARRAAEINSSLVTNVTEALVVLNETDALRDSASKQRAIARGHGIATLEALRAEHQAKGLTNDTQLATTERTQVQAVLRLLRQTDLANRFGTWNARELSTARQTLEQAKAQFQKNAQTFGDVALNYESFHTSFAELGKNVTDIRVAYRLSQTFAPLAQASGKLRDLLEESEATIAKTLEGSAVNTEFTRSLPAEKEPDRGLLARMSDLWAKFNSTR